MEKAVSYAVDGEVAVLTVQNPPVNTLDARVRRDLADGLARAQADDNVHAVLMIGGGRTFPAGADLGEMSDPAEAVDLAELCDLIENSDKIVIAAVHGNALGAGFELALAAHYRIAHQDARFGFPEINLGLCPCAGGTQRTPRLAGAKVALDLMLTGRSARAQSAVGRLFFDLVVADDLRLEAVRYAARLIEDKAAARRTREATIGFNDAMAYQTAVSDRRAALAGRFEAAPSEILRCVEAAALLPFEVGMEFERAAFVGLAGSDQSQAMRHMFFAERRAGKFAPVMSDATAGQARPLRTIGLIGGDIVGAGIAVACLDAGFNVILLERDNEALQTGKARVGAIYDGAVARNRLAKERRDERLERLATTLDINTLRAADLVIEAAVDDLAVKQQFFARLGEIAKPDTVFLCNTSYLDVNQIAQASGRAENVLAVHFLSPAHVKRVVEVVVGTDSSADALATCLSLIKHLKKTPVQAGTCDGLIGGRMLAAYHQAADYMLEDGATPYEIDQAMRAFGMTQGPYQMLDLLGLDEPWARRQRLAATQPPQHRLVRIADLLCQKGRLGRKTGAGYYRYDAKSREGQADPDVLALIEAERKVRNITPRQFSVAQIQRRCLAAMANEGARLLREGMALRPSDIDVVMVLGFGFPRWRGGPMKSADLTGMMEMRLSLEGFARADRGFWMPEPVFAELEKNGENFDRLNGLG